MSFGNSHLSLRSRVEVMKGAAGCIVAESSDDDAAPDADGTRFRLGSQVSLSLRIRAVQDRVTCLRRLFARSSWPMGRGRSQVRCLPCLLRAPDDVASVCVPVTGLRRSRNCGCCSHTDHHASYHDAWHHLRPLPLVPVCKVHQATTSAFIFSCSRIHKRYILTLSSTTYARD